MQQRVPPIGSPGLNRPLWKTFLVFLVPMILSGTLNNVFVGQMLGTQALAAVSGLFPIIFFFISLVIGIGAGASVLIGQAWGAHEPQKVKRIAGTALALGLAIGVAVALFGGTFTATLLKALGTPADVMPLALGYARVMMLAMPGLLVFILLTQLLRKLSFGNFRYLASRRFAGREHQYAHTCKNV